MPEPSQPLLTGLLRDVSRSFYLTLRVLPRAIRPQVGLAYLLARTTDTIADTGLVPADQRLAALAALRQRILGTASAPLAFATFAQHQASPAEATLLDRCEESLACLNALPGIDRQFVREVLSTITSGQELDLQRFTGAGAGNVLALENAIALDDYTYRVAGCVGEFWTRICREHLFPRAPLDMPKLLERGIRFGKGLQLVNILRDIPSDLRQGRCYLPQDELAAAQLAPGDLLRPANEPRLRPVYNAWLARAEGHLRSGWDYTNALPRNAYRLRLACAWPVLIGLETLTVLRRENMLDPAARRKISRGQVRAILVTAVARVPFPGAFRKLAPSASGSPAPAASNALC